jgi:hypothetical protein
MRIITLLIVFMQTSYQPRGQGEGPILRLVERAEVFVDGQTLYENSVGARAERADC